MTGFDQNEPIQSMARSQVLPSTSILLQRMPASYLSPLEHVLYAHENVENLVTTPQRLSLVKFVWVKQTL